MEQKMELLTGKHPRAIPGKLPEKWWQREVLLCRLSWENYSSDTASWLALAKPVSLNGYHSPVLSLQHFYDFQKSGNLEDYALVEISVDGINWSVLYRFSGTNEKLQQFSIPITLPQEAESLYFRFRIQSNNNGSGKGWYIDDITLTASPLPLSALQRLRLTPEKPGWDWARKPA